MSTTVDQRVVEMRFDNKQFESGVSTTMSSLDKLKQSLNLSGASKGLEEVGSAARKIDMNPLSSAVETVGLKFNAMYTIADQALRNITNSAMNAGKRIISALTIDPVKTGLQEYETQINAVQTILANTESKGTTLDDVTGALDELNAYADKTIYNFTEMTRNIGTFTAAGVDLDTSVTAIQGIANLAAVSGSTSQQASTAMYQLSQALSSGTVKLMDWNSVVNAGMGGQVFQDALKETARVHGIAIDSMIEENGSFRETLQEGWLTADILTETLEKFTMTTEGLTEAEIQANREKLKNLGYSDKQIEAIFKLGNTATDAATKVKTFTQLWDTLKETAQSGWTQTWELILGDFEEAKSFFSDLYNTLAPVLEASAKARNELLQGWADAGGRSDLIESLYNIFEAIGSVVKPIKEAFREIFPPMTVKQLTDFTTGLKEFTEKLKLSDEASNNLKRTFKGLFSILSIVGQIFSAVFKAVGSLFGVVGDFGGGVLSVTAVIGDWLTALNNMIKSSDVFNKVLQGIVSVIKFVASGLKTVFGFIGQKILSPGLELFHSLLARIGERMSQVGEAASGMKLGVSDAVDSMGAALQNCSFFKLLQGLWKLIKTIAGAIGKIFSSLTNGLFNAMGSGNFDGVLDFINSIITGGIGVGLIKFLKSVTEPLEGLGGLLEGVTGILDGVRGCFEAYQTQLKAGALIKIAAAIAILTASVLVLSTIDSEKLSGALSAITVMFADLMLAMSIFGKIGGDLTAVGKMSTTMIAVSFAVLILASALKKIAGLDMESLTTGLVGIAGLTGIVIATIKILGNGDGKAVLKGATQLVIFAAAIKILASACIDLAGLSWEGLAKGLVGVGALMAEISLFLNTAKFSGKAISTATGIVLLAAAMKILASACMDFGLMEWGEIGKSLAAMGGLLAEVVIFTNLTGNAKHVMSTGIALIAIAAAMKIFASATQDMAMMSWDEIGRGLVAMAGALAAVTIAVNLMPKNMVGKGVGLIAISTALLILSNTLGKMGGMSWEEVGRGLLTLGGSLAILAIGLHAMNGTLAGSAALLVATAALVVLTPVLAVLGAMSWESIAKGLVSIAGAFAVIGIAGLLLGPIIPSILGLSGALALIGLSALAIGAGLTAAGVGISMLSVGIGALATSLTAGATIIVAGLTAIIIGIIDLIPAIAVAIGKGIISICNVIAEGASSIGNMVKEVILSLCDILIECGPVIADTVLRLTTAVLESLVEYTPRIVDALFNFLIGVLDGIANNLPELIQAAMRVIGAFFEGVIQALGSIDTSSMIQGIAAVGLMAGLIVALSAITGFIPGAMLGVLGMGAVIAELAIVLSAVGALAQIPGLQWLIGEGGQLLQGIGNAIGGFIGGIVGGVMEGISASLPQVGTDLSTFMTNVQPFIDGAKKLDPSMLEGVNSLIDIVLAITAANFIEHITSWLSGGSSMESFATEIVALGNGLKGFSDAVSGVNPESITAAAGAAKALAEMSSHIPNEGGMVAWFTGENSISKFGNELPILGQGLKGFSDALAGVNAENIVAAAGAAKALAEMSTYIPNEGGMVAWFTGENSISKFSSQLPLLGAGLKGFSDALAGVNTENITAAASAAKALAEMAANIPNEGGVASWFAGDNSIAKFSGELVTLGHGLKGFSDALVGVNPETLTAAAGAARSLAEMCSYIPNQGGMVAWFTGEQSISKFSTDLVALGGGIKGFSEKIAGVNAESLTAAANAAKTIAEMCSYIPNQGGVTAWFTGEQSISKFSSDLVSLGGGLKGFSEKIEGMNAENVSAAAGAAKALAEMCSYIPNSGGIAAWFTGEQSISKFSDQLPALGEGLKGFSKSLDGLNPENVTAASKAAKTLAEMTQTVPDNSDKVVKFGSNLKTFGSHLKTYFSNTSGITADAISNSTKAIDAVKKVTSIDSGKVSSAVKAVNELVKMIRGMSSITADSTAGFSKAMSTLGKTSMDGFVKAFDGIDKKMSDVGQKAIDAFVKAVKNADSKVKKAGQDMVTSFAKGMEGKSKALSSAATKLTSDSVTAIRAKYDNFNKAGAYLVTGFANGISSNAYKAEAKARAMAKAAAKAAEEALGIESPSKVFYGIGDYSGQGFVNALDDYASKSYNAGSDMATAARNGLGDAIKNIQRFIDSGMDAQPTIRPVLDLSNVESGAGLIGSILGYGSSFGVSANVGAISAMMNHRNQNGDVSEVVSAINKLRKDLENVGGTTNNYLGDITYDDGSGISDAVKSLVRAAKIERRT